MVSGTSQLQAPVDIKYLSYSAIKMFLDNRTKFRKKYILKEKTKEENDSIRLGNLVDFNLTCNPLTKEQDFDKQFVLTSAPKPNGQMLDFVEVLKKRTVEAVDKNDVIQKDLDELIEIAFNEVKFDAAGNEVKFKKKDLTYVLTEFLEKKVGYDYYMEFRKSMNKMVVTLEEVEKAKVITDQLLRDPNTFEIFNPQDTEDEVEYLNQFPFEIEIDGYIIRGKIDRMMINKTRLYIKPWDIKITFQVETFEWAYLDDKYFIQNGLYVYALSELFPDYRIEPVDFIVGDSNAFLRPLVWHTSDNHAKQGMNGFDYRGRHYKGVYEALKEIKWHTEKNEWRIAYDNYRNRGNLSIKEFAL